MRSATNPIQVRNSFLCSSRRGNVSAEQFGGTLDGGDGRFQFVAGVGEEISPQVGGLALLGRSVVELQDHVLKLGVEMIVGGLGCCAFDPGRAAHRASAPSGPREVLPIALTTSTIPAAISERAAEALTLKMVSLFVAPRAQLASSYSFGIAVPTVVATFGGAIFARKIAVMSQIGTAAEDRADCAAAWEQGKMSSCLPSMH